ncbi:hypothetical protein COO60DRAFT_1642193 [Scenedesmus sp. NREL 46B-D3]|nr:hypothetical protein COO60DRAFT_1642193 [Scenedesmus sp. NREL 46B-D3]
MYAKNAFAPFKPAPAYTGVNLAMAESPAGQSLGLIHSVAHNAGNRNSTGCDYAASYRAHRSHMAIWQTQAVAIRLEIP